MNRFYLLLLVCIGCSTTILQAQTGRNCANAQVIAAGTYTVDTLYLGAATNPPVRAGIAARAKWYKYTPTTSGLMRISSCGGGADTRLFLYTGTRCDSLMAAGFSDDFCRYHPDSTDEYAAEIAKLVQANTPYYIEWDNAWSDADFSFSVSVSAFSPTANQVCATATNMLLGLNQIDSLHGFSSRGDANRANWYKYTATRTSNLTISSCGGDVDTRLWVYRGTCAGLSLVGDSDDDCLTTFLDSTASSVTIPVTSGSTYFVEWDDRWENYPFSFEVLFDAVSGIKNIDNQRFTLYPNPAEDFVTVRFDEKIEGIGTVLTVYNTLGQSVFSKKIGNSTDILRGEENIDITGWNKGVYFVELKNGQMRGTQKLIVR